MKKLKITNKDGYVYNLKDEGGNIYSINLEFFDIEELPKVEEFIYMNEELLDKKYEGYSTSYTFGGLDNKYGKENISINDIDVIKVVSDKTEIHLKRIYG